ncbi:unnamed protein product [Rhizophagus irregularis]|nr:unnamed protein product [Rhizophagus irregularis]
MDHRISDSEDKGQKTKKELWTSDLNDQLGFLDFDGTPSPWPRTDLDNLDNLGRLPGHELRKEAPSWTWISAWAMKVWIVKENAFLDLDFSLDYERDDFLDPDFGLGYRIPS